MLERTDAAGYVSDHSNEHSPNSPTQNVQHFGPYFQGSLPSNPLTGTSLITSTDEFPPTKASGNRGWLYYQPTGEIAIDLPDKLTE